MDFMSDEFVAIHHACHAGVKRVLKTDQSLYMYNASGHGAWEAALANLFAAGDTVLIVETGYFSLSWAEMATNLGIKVETFAADWRKGADIAKLAERLAKDKAHEIKAVLCRPQRDRDRHGPAGRRHPPRARRGQAPRPAALRHHLLAGVDRIQDGCLGRRRHRRRQPEGPDAADRHVVHRRQQQGARRLAQEQGAAPLLQLGADERPRAAEVHGHRAGAHVLRPAGIAQDARGGRPRRGVRPPCPPRRGDARRGARLGRRRQGPAALLPVARPALQLGDHGDDARGRELRPACARPPSIATTCRSAAGWGR